MWICCMALGSGSSARSGCSLWVKGRNTSCFASPLPQESRKAAFLSCSTASGISSSPLSDDVWWKGQSPPLQSKPFSVVPFVSFLAAISSFAQCMWDTCCRQFTNIRRKKGVGGVFEFLSVLLFLLFLMSRWKTKRVFYFLMSANICPK